MRHCCLYVLLVAMLPLALLPAHAADPLRARIENGSVEGKFTANGKVRAFLGIPYAAPPIDQLRWKSPQPAERWKGIRPAVEFGKRCMQFNPSADMRFNDAGPSEDCLTLNVWTPVGVKPGKLPVMVWIYGGGYTSGGTSEARQDGEFLAARGVVVVSMNYRLGIFGFFAHPELAEESGRGASGNYGLLDQAAALLWVQNNIVAFGGDPANVTLFGESAGSYSVSAQMASPQTKGLFQKAIGESGSAFFSNTMPMLPREAQEQTDAAFAQASFGSGGLSYLRALSTKDIMDAFAAGARIHPPKFLPVVDGFFLPQSVPEIFANGRQAHIPLLVGWNANESGASRIYGKSAPTPETVAAQARTDFGDNAAKFLALYPAATDTEAAQSAVAYASDNFMGYNTWRWIEAQTQTGASPTYRYFFTLAAPGSTYHPAGAGAFHSDEIEYVFGTLDSRDGAKWRPEDRVLSDRTGQYWTNFARTGNPNGPGLPVWPAYTPGWQVMNLDATPIAKPDPSRERYLFLDAVWESLQK